MIPFAIKPGVRLAGLRPEMTPAILAAYIVRSQLPTGHLGGLVLTSGLEGEHTPTSRHYLGFAVDFRTRDLADDDKVRFRDALRAALGAEYIVLLKPTHLHVQYNGSRDGT